jgi:DNA primase
MKKSDILKEIFSDDPTEVFDALCMDYYDRGNYINGVCPCHVGDNNTAFSWLKDNGTWKCWTHGCHDTNGNDIFGLIKGVQGFTFPQCMEFLEEIREIEYDDATIEAIQNKKFVQEQRMRGAQEKEVIDEKALDKLEKCDIMDAYLEGERGFEAETLDFFEVGYCGAPDAIFYNRAVFPVRDHDGDLVALTGRWIGKVPDKFTPKWKHFNRTSDFLYGFHYAKPHIEESQEVILVEGPLGVLRCVEAGIMNAVCIFGLHISERQKKVLLESGAFKVRLALDNDDAGNKACQVMMGEAGTTKKTRPDYLGNYFYVERVDLGDHTDLDEMTAEEVRELLA